MNKWYSRLISENIYGVGVKIATLFGGIATAILFPKILGPEQFGYFALVFSLANMWLFFSNFGIDESMIKFISLSKVRENTKEYIKFFSKWKYFLTSLSAIILFILSDFLSKYLLRNLELSLGIKMSCIFIIFYSLYTYYTNVFIGLNKNKYVLLSAIIFHILRVILPILFLYIIFDYSSLIFGTAIASLFAVFILILLFSKIRIPDKYKTLDFKLIRTFMFYLSLGYLASLLNQWMSPIVLGFFQSSSEVGFYRVGWLWISAIGLLVPFSSQVLFSFYSERHESKAKGEIESAFKYTLKYSMAFAVLSILGLILVSDYFIQIIYGPEYAPVSLIIIALSPLSIGLVLDNITIPPLMGIGKISIVNWYVLGIGILVTVFNILVAPVYGAVGIAVTTTFIRLLGIILLTFYVKRLLQIKIDYLPYVKILSSAIATFVIFYYLKFVITSLIMGILYCLGIMLLYALFLLIFRAIEFTEIQKIFHISE